MVKCTPFYWLIIYIYCRKQDNDMKRMCKNIYIHISLNKFGKHEKCYISDV